jgi:hypothetical protein
MGPGRPPGSPHVFLTMPQLTRVRELRAGGLSWEGIRIVLTVDYGQAPAVSTLKRHAGNVGCPRIKGAGVSHGVVESFEKGDK